MAQQVRRRPQTQVSYSSGNKVNESMSRGMIYRELYLRLRGQPTLTAVNNSSANTQIGDEWGVINRIDIIANNTDVIKSIDGNTLWWLNYFLYGAKPPVTPTLGDGATANPSFDSTLILPFWIPRSVKPLDTALDARELSDLKIEVTWGSFTDINSAATAWTAEPTLDVYSLESFNVAGPFSQWRLYPIEKSITATNAQFQILLPVGPMYRGFLINTTEAGADTAAILNNVKLKAGTTVFHDLPASVMHDLQPLRSNVQRGFSGTAYDDLRIGDDNDVDGWYYLDHVTDGRNTEAIDTLGFSEFELELDVTAGAASKVIVYPQQIIPVRGV